MIIGPILENVSQIIFRNLSRFPVGVADVVNPAPDGLFREIEGPDRLARLSCTSFGDYQQLHAMGADVHYEVIPAPERPLESVIMVLPREKERLEMSLHAISSQMHGSGRLWLAGPNRAGIKSSPRHLKQFFNHVTKLDNARHCTLFEASQPLQGSAFSLESYESRWTIDQAGTTTVLASLPGVFAHGRLDKGTELLLEALKDFRPQGKILDFASGCGVIALSILGSSKDTDLVLLDDSALAIESGKRSLRANGLEATSLPSNGLSELQGQTFDWIISNPPFHRGIKNELDIAATFFRDAGTFLSKKGKILVVFNRHLPYTGWIRKFFKNVDCLAQNQEFTVIQASKSK